MINRIKLQGLDFTPRILIVCSVNFWNNFSLCILLFCDFVPQIDFNLTVIYTGHSTSP